MAYRPKIKNANGTLTDLPLEAETSVKLKTARTIGLSGVSATAKSFDGSGNVTIPVTEVPVSLLTGLLEKTYPVGAIYMSTVYISPASIFGGTWTRLYDRFLVGGGSDYSIGSTGGEKTHKLTTTEMPKHTHYANKYKDGMNYIVHYSSNETTGFKTSAGSGGHGVLLAALENTGGGNEHNNLPPYLAVYMWKRTA